MRACVFRASFLNFALLLKVFALLLFVRVYGRAGHSLFPIEAAPRDRFTPAKPKEKPQMKRRRRGSVRAADFCEGRWWLGTRALLYHTTNSEEIYIAPHTHLRPKVKNDAPKYEETK